MSRELELAVTSSQTTIRVNTTLNTTDFPIPGVIQIGSEQIKYQNLTNREFMSCIRGFNGTTAAAHIKESDVAFVSAAPSTSTTIDTINSVTAGDTRLLLWDVDSGALAKVSVGADDSGGTGFKVLRIPN
jgi:hypothetical protein